MGIDNHLLESVMPCCMNKGVIAHYLGLKKKSPSSKG